MAKLPPNEGSMLEEMLIALVAMSKSFSTYYCKQEKATEILLKEDHNLPDLSHVPPLS